MVELCSEIHQLGSAAAARHLRASAFMRGHRFLPRKKHEFTKRSAMTGMLLRACWVSPGNENGRGDNKEEWAWPKVGMVRESVRKRSWPGWRVDPLNGPF